MTEENFISNNIFDNLSNLSIEQKTKLEDLTKIISSSLISKDGSVKSIDLLIQRQINIRKFNQELKLELGNEVDLDNYILGRKLIGSTVHGIFPFDIVDESDPNGMGLIEKFIRSLEE